MKEVRINLEDFMDPWYSKADPEWLFWYIAQKKGVPVYGLIELKPDFNIIEMISWWYDPKDDCQIFQWTEKSV